MPRFVLKTREEYIAAFKKAIKRQREIIKQSQEEFAEIRRREAEERTTKSFDTI